jgi:hypothetical protein
LGRSFSDADSSAYESRQTPVKADPIERKLHEDKEEVRKTIVHKILHRAGGCWVAEAQLNEEQIEQERGGEAERYEPASAQEKNYDGQFEGSEEQGKCGDVRHHERGPDAAHQRIEGRSPKADIDLRVVEGAQEMDQAPSQVPERDEHAPHIEND